MYDNSVSIAKGIAIILMVMGHASYPCYFNDFLTIIRMPLFFVMSGYLFKDKYLHNSIDFFKKKVRGIYIPYVKYCLLFIILHNQFFRVGIYNDSFIDVADVSRLYSIKDFVYRGFRILSSMTHYDRLLGGYWFLHTLFFASLIALESFG